MQHLLFVLPLVGNHQHLLKRYSINNVGSYDIDWLVGGEREGESYYWSKLSLWGEHSGLGGDFARERRGGDVVFTC